MLTIFVINVFMMYAPGRVAIITAMVNGDPNKESEIKRLDFILFIQILCSSYEFTGRSSPGQTGCY